MVHTCHKDFTCKQCDYSCAHAGKLKQNIQAKSRLNVHTATFLVQASKLKTHKLTHSGEEPFICIQCNFSCTQADKLKRHMKTHTGEKTHKCAQCDYSFIHCQKLENHMRTHTGDV